MTAGLIFLFQNEKKLYHVLHHNTANLLRNKAMRHKTNKYLAKHREEKNSFSKVSLKLARDTQGIQLSTNLNLFIFKPLVKRHTTFIL